MASKCNTLHGIKLTAIVEHNGETPHTKDSIIDLDLSNNLLTMFLPKLE